MKICNKCKQEQELENFCFRKTPAGTPYRNSICDTCRKAQVNKATKAYRSKPENQIKERNSQMLSKYGIDLVEWQRLFDAQEGLCAICQEDLKNCGQVDVDHDHITGKVRGLLCNSCNQGLGKFKDSAARLDKAAQYLRTHGRH